MYCGVKFALLRSIRCNKRVWPGELLGSLSGHTTRIAKCNSDTVEWWWWWWTHGRTAENIVKCNTLLRFPPGGGGVRCGHMACVAWPPYLPPRLQSPVSRPRTNCYFWSEARSWQHDSSFPTSSGAIMINHLNCYCQWLPWELFWIGGWENLQF